MVWQKENIMEDNIFRSVSDIIKENKMHKKEYWEKTMKKDTKTDLIILINTLDNIDDLNEAREIINDRTPKYSETGNNA